MARRSREEVSGLAELVEARSTALLRLAYAVVGDRQLAQDLLQEALVKVYVAWSRLRDVAGADKHFRVTVKVTGDPAGRCGAFGWVKIDTTRDLRRRLASIREDRTRNPTGCRGRCAVLLPALAQSN